MTLQKIYHHHEQPKELHIAPMLDVSTPEFHALFRILSKHCVLWTEMVVDETLIHTKCLHHHLQRQPPRPPPPPNNNKKNNNPPIRPKVRTVCQLGGRDPSFLSQATTLACSYGYDAIDLNVDCPSPRVSGVRRFGAALAKEPERLVEIVTEMVKAAKQFDSEKKKKQSMNDGDDTEDKEGGILVSVKTRIGVVENTDLCGSDDDTTTTTTTTPTTIIHGNSTNSTNQNDDDTLVSLLQRLRTEACCRRFVIHARVCLLDGITTPAQNRIVPPLNYPRVYELCRKLPDCEFVLNGGVPGLEVAKRLLCGYSGIGSDVKSDTVVEDGSEMGNNDGTIHTHTDAQESNITTNTNTNNTPTTQHTVPCQLCNASNGSCTAPPSSPQHVPANLIGCMIGRAAMENPSQFWDIDRYFYGEDRNPCRNRREVLEKYCRFLEGVYPNRCGDDDDTVTTRMEIGGRRSTSTLEEGYVSGDGGVDYVDTDGCDICREYRAMHRRNDHTPNVGNDTIDKNIETKHNVTSTSSTTNTTKKPKPKPTQKPPPRSKISSKVIDRSLKPILGIFFNLRKSKAFRRACDRLGRDRTVRNCGPAFILHRAIIESDVEDLLDLDFVKTEELREGELPVHVAPVVLSDGGRVKRGRQGEVGDRRRRRDG